MRGISIVANRRGLRLAPIISGCLVLAACGVGNGPLGDLDDPTQRDALEEAQTEAKQAADYASLAAVEVQEQVERFDTENWRDVVGDVRAAADEATEAADKSAKAADAAAVALEDY